MKKPFKILGYIFILGYLLFTLYMILSVGFPSLRFGDALDGLRLFFIWGMATGIFMMVGGALLFNTD